MDVTTPTIVDELAATRRALELVREPIFIVDGVGGRLVYVNAAACKGLGMTRDELIGRAWSDVAQRLGEATLCDVGGRQVVAVFQTPLAKSPRQSCAQRDVLTGLPTRASLLARQACNPANPLSRLALLFIDLDGFKQVNDTWGHMAGDHVLRIAAQRLSECVRPGDLIVRYGGDEFLVLVDAVARRRDVDRLARRIGRALQRPIVVAGREISVSASIGVALCKSTAVDIDELIAVADRAMYRNKSRKRHLLCTPASFGR